MSRLQYLENRLKILKNNLKEEKSNDNNKLYISDLCECIKDVKDEIEQLRFAYENPIVMVDKNI